MKNQIFTAFSICLLGTAAASAQLYVTETEFVMNDVTNEGIAIGHQDQNTPHKLWNPFTNEFTLLGGISAGNGIGGVGRISADGKTVFATNYFEAIPISTAWERSVYPEFDYNIIGFMRLSATSLYAIGNRANGNGSTVLESSGTSGTWISNVSGNTLDDVRITSYGYFGPYGLMIGCEGGKVFTSKANSTWTEKNIRPAGDETAIKAITAMDYTKLVGSAMNFDGAVGFETEDGGYGVWYTNGATSRYADYYAATGVSGVPTSIRLAGDVFFMTTRNGHIQKSTDKGKTWQDVFTVNGPLHKIAFADANKGIALGDEKVYITFDGGQNWSEKSLLASATPFAADGNKKWNDVVWDGNKVIVVGNSGLVYASDDNANTFARVTGLPAESADANFGAVTYSDGKMTVGADAGTFLRKGDDTTTAGVCAGRYDVENDTWEPMETLGIFTIAAEPYASGVEGASDDGKYIVGLAYDTEYNSTQGYPVIWNEKGEITRLNNLFDKDGKAAKATAVSYDGSVVVGWQDRMGPWMGSVWRRQADGSYEQSLIFDKADTKFEDIDFNKWDDIVNNCAGAVNAVSANGKWIGGNGGGEWYATKEAWIWSEETGFIYTGGGGSTMEISDDGNTAIGYGESGFSGWIWTKENGRQDLNTVAANLGATFNGFSIISAYAMSPNGRYVVGWGMTGDVKHGYVLDLKPINNGITDVESEQIKAAVYPNPVVSELHVDLPYDGSEINTVISLYNMQGSLCRQLSDCRQSNVINVDGLAAGMYLLDVKAGNVRKTFKVIVK